MMDHMTNYNNMVTNGNSPMKLTSPIKIPKEDPHIPPHQEKFPIQTLIIYTPHVHPLI